MYTSAMPLQARRRGSSAFLLALSFVGIIACKTEGSSVGESADKLAKEVCDAIVECDCQYPNGSLYEHCLAEIAVSFDSAAQINLVEGLSFDGACADEAVAEIRERACGVTIVDPEAKCEAPCKLWYGPMGKGGTCSDVNGSDNCKQGLVCGDEGVCVDPCAEPSLPAIGEPCAPFLGCVEGAFCDTDTGLTPVCQALPLAGQPCTSQDELCAEGLVCDTTSDPENEVCATLPVQGEECLDFQCARGLYCDDGATPPTCATMPTLGQPCPFGACQAPYVCNDEQTCADAPPAICWYYEGLPVEECGVDEFTCDDGACVDVGLVCDGTPECGDGSDEAPINPSCGGGCDFDEFECDEGSCIPFDLQCDTAADCPDGSDEAPVNPFCP
jgi:hypothetical protein